MENIKQPGKTQDSWEKSLGLKEKAEKPVKVVSGTDKDAENLVKAVWGEDVFEREILLPQNLGAAAKKVEKPKKEKKP